MSSTGEDELEDVLSDVDEVPKSKKKKKAKKSSRESRSSKRQRPVREVSLLFLTLQFDQVNVIFLTFQVGAGIPV